MFDLATFAEVEALKRRTHAMRRIEYIPASRVVTVRRPGRMIVRALGAGGGGGSGAAWNSTGQKGGGGNAGTVGLLDVRVKPGDEFVVTIPAAARGGSGESYGVGNPGQPGGTLTVTGPGVNISIPGGLGGKAAGANQRNPANPEPSGLDVFYLGDDGSALHGIGGSPRRFWGGLHADALLHLAGGGQPLLPVPVQACLLLMPALLARPGSLSVTHGFGVGGGAGANGPGNAGASGGVGAGGGGGGVAGASSGLGSHTPGGVGGAGGTGWVTLEFLEDDHVR